METPAAQLADGSGEAALPGQGGVEGGEIIHAQDLEPATGAAVHRHETAGGLEREFGGQLQGQRRQAGEAGLERLQIGVHQLQRRTVGRAIGVAQAEALALALQGGAQALPGGQAGAAAPAQAGGIQESGHGEAPWVER